jgi:DNA-binding LacI/PurR family transcriptional regulator
LALKHEPGKGARAAAVGLRELGQYLKLSPTTVSLVLNGAPAAASIPKETQRRVFEAARTLNYRPNFLARSLRSQRTYLIGVMVPELGEGYSSLVLNGVEEYLLAKGYVYLVTSHRHQPELIERAPRLLSDRCVEGIIVVDTPVKDEMSVPVVAVSGHGRTPGVTNIILDHDKAAYLGLRHLMKFGHKRIAFFQGQSFSSDSEIRWQAIRHAATRLGLPVHPALVTRLEGDTPSPRTGYCAARRLLESGEPFTALWAFNDISAIGAVRALIEAGKSVPRDVSVLGFDDVYGAAFHNPALTTVRQPLTRMGFLAAETLLQRIAGAGDAPSEIGTEPELVVRESTAPAPAAS